jgi:V/A-type H+-transporting ATPase subunit D
MAKIKFTKGELKRQRDALRQYRRYLPTLQLKKQQLQLEILKELRLLREKRDREGERTRSVEAWSGLLSDHGLDIRRWLGIRRTVTETKNVAGVNLPVFKEALFQPSAYDLFTVPLWVDRALEELKMLVSLREEIRIIEEGVAILRRELRTTTQRVNLFEKVKIPEAIETIRAIKIYIGDQLTNAVGRSKIAKRKLESAFSAGVLQ